MITIKRASTSAALAFVTATMSFGTAAYAQDANRPAATEAEVENTAAAPSEPEASVQTNQILADNEDFTFIYIATPEGYVPMLKVKVDPNYDILANGFSFAGELASGQLSQDGSMFIVLTVRGDFRSNSEQTENFTDFLSSVAGYRNIFGLPLAVVYIDGTEGNLHVNITTNVGDATGAEPYTISNARELAELMVRVRAASEVLDENNARERTPYFDD